MSLGLAVVLESISCNIRSAFTAGMPQTTASKARRSSRRRWSSAGVKVWAWAAGAAARAAHAIVAIPLTFMDSPLGAVGSRPLKTGRQHHAKAGGPAHHPVVALGHAVQGQELVHRADA